MMSNPTSNLNNNDLSDIRDAVPALDLLAIRSLRRAGFRIVRQDSDDRDGAAMRTAPRQDARPEASRTA